MPDGIFLSDKEWSGLAHLARRSVRTTWLPLAGMPRLWAKPAMDALVGHGYAKKRKGDGGYEFIVTDAGVRKAIECGLRSDGVPVDEA